ncbi:rhodanese-like domain-containing protein [Flavobacteriales bacterium]|nr:rhodanese-like domain-containing protein [Flavobacteriales bacterium]
MKNLLIVSMVWAIVISGCAQENNVNQQRVQEIEIAKRVSKEAFKDALTNMDQVQLVDVRTPNEFKNGKIENAVNIDFNGTNFKEEIGQLDKSKPTLIYCQGGGRSAMAMQVMVHLGFIHVLELNGGFSNW